MRAGPGRWALGPGLYRLLLRLFPRAFRERFGADMAAVFADRAAEARRAGRLTALRWWARTIADAMRHGVAERRATSSVRARGDGLMRGLVQDVRFAVRLLARKPGLTGAAVLSLGVGLAAAGAVTSLLDAAGFRPVAMTDPLTLVQVQRIEKGGASRSVSWDAFTTIRDSTRTLAAVGAAEGHGVAVSGGDEAPAVAMMEVVSSSYLRTLGVRPAIGRDFGVDEDQVGALPVAVISPHVWRTRFGADPHVAGRTVELNRTPVTVVGVLPDDFPGLNPFVRVDVWIPFATLPALLPAAQSARSFTADLNDLTVVARLQPGIALSQVNDELDAIARAMPRVAGSPGPSRYTAAPEEDIRLGGLRSVRLMVWGLVGLVVLVGCANVAGLLASQADARRRELAVRATLGATRGRLVRQLLTESMVLALASAACALMLAWWLIGAFPALVPPYSIPLAVDTRFDLRVILMTCGVALATVLAFGVSPAVSAARRGLTQRLARFAGAESSRLRWWSGRNVLVVSQIAASLVLLVAGTLLVRGIRSSGRLDPGFTLRSALLVTTAPVVAGYHDVEARAFFATLLDRASHLPGVSGAALTRRVPFSLDGGGAAKDVEIPGSAATAAAPMHVHYTAVSPSYFAVMGVHLLEGRGFAATDGPTAPPVALVNATMAKTYWPGGNAVGQRIVIRGTGTVEVVGVAEDGKYNSLTEAPDPFLFLPLNQAPSSEQTLILRTARDPGALAPLVRSAIAQLDPRMPVLQVVTLDEHMRLATLDVRLSGTIVGALAVAALVLSVAGLYGVIAFVVSRRTREVGIRIALGARPADIRHRVLGYGAALGASGLLVGLPLARLAAEALGGTLYGISPSDPPTYASVSLVVLVVAVAAAWAPARRAMRVDPVSVLRAE